MVSPQLASSVKDVFEAASLNTQQLVIKTSKASSPIFQYKSNDVTPREYLQWAKQDIRTGGKKGRIGGISNAKKAIDLLIQQTMKSLNLAAGDNKSKSYGKFISANLDTYLDGGNLHTKLMASLGIAPSVLISDIWSKRNDAEHEHIIPTDIEVKQAVEVAELLILSLDTREQAVNSIEILDVEILQRSQKKVDILTVAPKSKGVIFTWEYGEDETKFFLSYDNLSTDCSKRCIYEFEGHEEEYLLLLKAAFCNESYDLDILELTINKLFDITFNSDYHIREFYKIRFDGYE
jgi:hypothetical protein